jgi:phosphatidate cytidylyltransferase
MTKGDALLLGVAVAVLAPIGDLFESMVKRDAGVKDSGTIFGPHGGALDRLDAIIFTIVAGYYVWVAVIH